MGKTLAEKILSKACGQAVRAGDFVWAKVHVVSYHDKANFEFLDRNNLKAWDPGCVIFSFDHLMYPEHGLGIAGLPKIREWARQQGIPKENIYDIGRHGNSHQVPAEHGWALPGTVFVSSDTQASTMGAFNCFALACVGSTPCIMATGDTWLTAPECIRIVLRGALPKGVLGKDIYLRLMQDLKGVAGGRVIEFDGPGIESMSIDVRMAVANGATHLGAVTMIFPADRKLLDYVTPRAREAFETVTADPDAQYVATFEYDLSGFEPLVSGPDDPARIQSLHAVQGTAVQAAYIGSCSAGRFDDLALAAEVLTGNKLHPDVRLVVTPISSGVMQQAAEAGLLAIFAQAGATITTPGCGACFYGNQSPLLLGDGEVCITGSVENWPGRMGSKTAKIYLANASVVAASAIAGRISDPAAYYATPTGK